MEYANTKIEKLNLKHWENAAKSFFTFFHKQATDRMFELIVCRWHPVRTPTSLNIPPFSSFFIVNGVKNAINLLQHLIFQTFQQNTSLGIQNAHISSFPYPSHHQYIFIFPILNIL